MWQPNRSQWAVIWTIAALIVLAWAPADGRSLGVKALNWIADPTHALPDLPPTLPMGLDDDGDAVAAHDAQEQEFYHAYDGGGVTRTRLKMKTFDDPLDPTTEHQVLVGLGVCSALTVWWMDGRKKKTPGHF